MNHTRCRSFATLSFVLIAFTSSTPAQDATTQDAANRVAADPAIQRFVQNSMQANDKNRDGHVTKDESVNQLKKNFDRVDTDRDGKITTTELTVLAKRMRNSRRVRNGAAEKPATPEGVSFQADIPYRPGNKKWKLDLARPKDVSATPRPAIVFIHGGGWRSGDKGGGQWRSLPMDYAARGYVCISINYRLTDEATVLDCIADCKCAVRWLRSNAKEYNVDPERIGAYGNSAGAHLVSILGLASAEAELEGDGPFLDESSLVQAVCCSAPPSDFENWGKNRSGNATGTPSRLFGNTNVDAAKSQASPVTHANEQAPPFLIIHGTADKTVPVSQGDALHRELREAGAKDVTYLKIEGAGHGVFNQHSERTLPAMRAFFDRVLQPTDDENSDDLTQ